MPRKDYRVMFAMRLAFAMLCNVPSHCYAGILLSYLTVPSPQPNYVRTIEDEVELQRQKKLADLKEKGIKGTPITEASFKEWQERKRKAKQDEARKLVEKEFKKKKGGKGLSVLSGRDLFEYKRELFKDDEDAGDIDDFKDTGLPSELVEEEIKEVAEKVQSNLFLDGDDDDLDDLDDDDLNND